MYDITDVDVVITASEPTGQPGTWYPLIYVKGTGDKYDEYAKLSDMVKDYAETTDAYKAAQLIFAQDKEYLPEKIAVCTGSESAFTGLTKYMDKSWRQLIVAGEEFDASLAASIETTEKLYFTHFKTKDALTTAKIDGYTRTVAFVYTADDVVNPEAAIVGRTAGYAAGSFTYHAKEVKGVTPETFTKSEVNAIVAAGGNVYVNKNGRIASHGGVVGSGEWIDIVDAKDYIIQNIRYNVQEVFLNNKKVAYTNAGIALIESATVSVLASSFNNGIIAGDDDGKGLYTTSFADRSQTTTADRISRNYPYGGFEFELAGAIHSADKIKGLIIA